MFCFSIRTTVHVSLQNTRQRQDILRLILAGENVSCVFFSSYYSHVEEMILLNAFVSLSKSISHLCFLCQITLNRAQPVTASRFILCKCLILLSCFSSQLSNAINLKEIAEKTDGYSGSDLRELCRDAAMYRVRDYVRKEQMRQIAQQLQDCQEEEKYDSFSNTHKIS